jgi:hypothetical protein
MVTIKASHLAGPTDASDSTPPERSMQTPTPERPDTVTRLQAVYGPPSQAGFGSAVFFVPLAAGDDLTGAALAHYRTFVGARWERPGEQAWMEPWRQVYVRPAGAQADIAAELRAISDPDALRSVPMFLDAIDDPEAARAALGAAFDAPAVGELRVFNLGDGGAMSGLLIAARHAPGGAAILLVFLMD